MRRYLLVLVLFVFSTPFLAQEQNLAAIVDQQALQIDTVFVTKISVMAFLGIAAFFSYWKFKQTDK